MTNHAKSNSQKRQELVAIVDFYMDIAVTVYQGEQSKGPGKKKMGLQAVCSLIEEKCLREKKVAISLSKSSLERHMKGVPSQAQSNSTKKWLTDNEESTILMFALEMASQGWPLSPRRLEDHANLILHARCGDSFIGVGKTWAGRFAERHSSQLKPYWSRPLDTSRARAVNPTTKEAFFKLLAEVITGAEDEEPIPPELSYGADETGVQDGIGTREYVYGPPGQKIQYQQRSGGRENTTVLEVICGDGTTLPPTVIFKGENFQRNWRQENPLQAVIGHECNRYTDGEIGAEWIKLFDKWTRQKAAGRRRLLLVDGHNSHYTLAFLLFAREQGIHVLCYPSHSTHVYQGLDVVIFSALKRAWSEYRDEYERETGLPVTKDNFLVIYAKVHNKALTETNILAAFRKTRVCPFDPSVITAAMMAPSATTSTEWGLPLLLSSPVQVMSDMIHRMLARQIASEESADALPETPTRVRTSTNMPMHGMTPIRHAVDGLTSTSASFLVSQSPPVSTSQIPAYKPFTISPFKPSRYGHLLSREPVTEFETELLAALAESESRDGHRKESMVDMQATVLLQDAYTKKVQRHLQEKENKKGNKGNKLFGNGMPKLLTNDEFFNRVEELDAETERKAWEREQRSKIREKHAQTIAEWKRLEEKRKERKEERKLAWKLEVDEWNLEAAAVKAEKRRLGWTKPKLGILEKGVPRPKLPEGAEGEEEEDGQNNGDGDNNDDELMGGD